MLLLSGRRPQHRAGAVQEVLLIAPRCILFLLGKIFPSSLLSVSSGDASPRQLSDAVNEPVRHPSR